MTATATAPIRPRPPQRPFDAVMIALSTALLVIFGIVIGRFLVASQAVDVVDHFDAELSNLRAEVAELHRQLRQSETQTQLLRESSDRNRQLAVQQQSRADRLATRQLLTDQMIAGIAQSRDQYREELRRWIVMNRSMPPADLLRVADELFDNHVAALQRVSTGEFDGLPALPRLQMAQAPSVPASPSGSIGSNLNQPAADGRVSQPPLPALPAPGAALMADALRPPSLAGSRFAAAPPRQPGSYTFFSPQRDTQLAGRSKPSGITFHSTADAGDTVRR